MCNRLLALNSRLSAPLRFGGIILGAIAGMFVDELHVAAVASGSENYRKAMEELDKGNISGAREYILGKADNNLLGGFVGEINDSGNPSAALRYADDFNKAIAEAQERAQKAKNVN